MTDNTIKTILADLPTTGDAEQDEERMQRMLEDGALGEVKPVFENYQELAAMTNTEQTDEPCLCWRCRGARRTDEQREKRNQLVKAIHELCTESGLSIVDCCDSLILTLIFAVQAEATKQQADERMVSIYDGLDAAYEDLVAPRHAEQEQHGRLH
jgi:hypothetical protein